MSSEETSLYHRIGGQETIQKLMHSFYETVVTDPEIGPFFENVDVNKIRTMQEEFFGAALGGPVEYTGIELARAHSSKGIERKHFAHYVELLLNTLQSFDIDEKDITEIIDRVNLYVNDIVGVSNASD